MRHFHALSDAICPRRCDKKRVADEPFLVQSIGPLVRVSSSDASGTRPVRVGARLAARTIERTEARRASHRPPERPSRVSSLRGDPSRILAVRARPDRCRRRRPRPGWRSSSRDAPIASPRNPGMSESSLFGVKRRAEEAARDPNAGFASAMDLLAREEARIEAKASETARAVRKVVSDATSAAPAVPEDAPHVGTPRAEDPPVPLGDEIAAADPDAARFVAAVMAAAAVTAVDLSRRRPRTIPRAARPEPAPEPLAAEASPEPLAPEPAPEPLAAEASPAPLAPEPAPEPLAASPSAASPSAPETPAASPSVGPRALSSSSPSRPDAVGVPAALSPPSPCSRRWRPRLPSPKRREPSPLSTVRGCSSAGGTRRYAVRVKTQRAIARVARRFADPSEPVAVEGSAEPAALEASRAADDAHVTPSKPIDVDAAPEEGTEAWLVRSAVKSNASLIPASPKAEVEEAAAAAAEVADELEPDDTIFEEASKIGRDLIRGLLPDAADAQRKVQAEMGGGGHVAAPGATCSTARRTCSGTRDPRDPRERRRTTAASRRPRRSARRNPNGRRRRIPKRRRIPNPKRNATRTRGTRRCRTSPASDPECARRRTRRHPK